MLKLVYLELTLLLEVLLLLAALPFLVEVCYEFVTGVWEVELRAAGVLAGCIELARVMRLMFIALSSLFNSSLSPVLLFRRRLKSVADVLKGIKGTRGLLSLFGLLY